jgi:hydroxymethylglutaryl-CoA lyase
VEAGSFVSPKWVPQMGNSGEVFKELASFIAANPQVTFAGLTPNMKGLEGAMAANCKEVAIFGAASESFSKKNINMSIDEALGKQGEVATSALASGLTVRGYVSCVVGEDAVVVKLNIRVDDTLSLLGNS